jgi:hypothetical protein
MASRTRFGIVNMGGAKEGIKTTMEVDSIVVEVATKSIHVAPNTMEATTEIAHPSTLSTNIETKAIKNLQHGYEAGIALMVK